MAYHKIRLFNRLRTKTVGFVRSCEFVKVMIESEHCVCVCVCVTLYVFTCVNVRTYAYVCVCACLYVLMLFSDQTVVRVYDLCYIWFFTLVLTEAERSELRQDQTSASLDGDQRRLTEVPFASFCISSCC